MRLALLHRRLAVGMGLAGLVAFAGGAGFEPTSAILAALALVTALFWHPSPRLSARLERVWLPIAVLLVLRAIAYVFVWGGDVVVPVVDLLLVLLCAEALRSLDSPNDIRLYALSFALLLAATAYRPGVLFAVAFVAYLTLGTVALTVGHIRRRADHFGAPEPELSRRFLLGTTALSGVVLLISATVFLTFPRVSRAWSGRGETLATSIAGFSDEISLAEHGATIHANPEIVLRVEFPSGRPESVNTLRWRGRSYDRFDGVRWSRSGRMRPSMGQAEWYRAWSDSLVVQKIFAAPLDVHALFALHPLVDVEAHSQIHPLFDQVGDFIYWGNDTPVYTAVSVAGTPPPDSLRRAETGYMADSQRYLQLPELPERVHALADSLTAGASTRYDKAVAIERWLREFDYTLDLPASARTATLDHFLFQRRAGHCEYFSSAMVVLLRSAGVQARNVNGFLGGQWSDFGEYLAVTQNEAHSWVEVWFPGYGWVEFDPTPAGGGASRSSRIWFWPGRFLLDGLQHRWSKWILDYDVTAQSDLLQRVFGGVRGALQEEEGDAGGSSWGWLWTLGIAAILVGGAVVLIRREPDLGPESRLYVRLLDACRDAGLAPATSVTPLDLVDRLRAAGHPATEPARAVVKPYLESRFGGRELEPGERDVMREAVRRARRMLS